MSSGGGAGGGAGGGVREARALALLNGRNEINKASRLTARNKWLDFMITYSS